MLLCCHCLFVYFFSYMLLLIYTKVLGLTFRAKTKGVPWKENGPPLIDSSESFQKKLLCLHVHSRSPSASGMSVYSLLSIFSLSLLFYPLPLFILPFCSSLLSLMRLNLMTSETTLSKCWKRNGKGRVGDFSSMFEQRTINIQTTDKKYRVWDACRF